MTKKSNISAAEIQVPAPVPPKPAQAVTCVERAPVDVDAVFRSLRMAERACSPDCNWNDRAFVLITVCIEHGLVTKGQIIGTLSALGFKHGHIAKMLETGISSDWWCDNSGRYVLRETPAA